MLLKVYKNTAPNLIIIASFSIFSYFLGKTKIIQKNYYEKYTP